MKKQFELGTYVTFASGPGLSREGKVIAKQLYYGNIWLTIEYLVGEEPYLILREEGTCNHA